MHSSDTCSSVSNLPGIALAAELFKFLRMTIKIFNNNNSLNAE